MTTPVKPFLITKDSKGDVRLTIREIRRNSQGYPWVQQTLVEQSFKNAAAARAYATQEFGAKAGEFSTK